MNRNNFMAEKIAYAASVGATGVHVVDLVEKYVKEMGDPTADFTVEEYLSDVNAMRHGSEKIRLYDKYIGRMSVKYNTAGRKRFTPKERKVLQILSFFDERMKTVALSDTIHDDYVKLAPEGYQSCLSGRDRVKMMMILMRSQRSISISLPKEQDKYHTVRYCCFPL